ncbi:MAG: outer rane efflux protein [Chthoniobacteraceae bacterium]|nr:outer rane efflux protein [Chthoniobacteraceae bacterium]
MRSFTPPSFFTKSIPGSLLILCGTILTATAVESPRLKSNPERLPGPRAEMPATSRPRGAVLTLEQAYDEALASDESIQLAYMNVRKARLLRWQALSRFEPTISANIGRRENDATRFSSEKGRQDRNISETGFEDNSGTRSGTDRSVFKDATTQENFFENKQSLTSRPRDTLTTRTNDVFSSRTNRDSATLILEQPLIDLTVFPAYRLGRLAEAAAQLQFQFTVRDVLLGVTRAYYDTLKQERIVAVSQQTLDLSNQQLLLAEERFTAGAVLRTEVLRAQATAGDARRLVIISEGALGTAKDTLRSILDRPDSNFRLVEPAPGTRPAQPMQALLSDALVHREDYLTSTNNILQEKERRNGVAASFMPLVNAEFRARSYNDSNSGSGRATERRTLDSSGSSLDTSSQVSTGTESRVGTPPVVSPLTQSTTERSTSNFSSIRSEKRTERTSSRYNTDETEWEALLTVKLPLGGERSLELRNAGYLISDAEINRLKLEKQIERELYDASLQVNTLEETVKLLRSEVQAAEQNYKDLQNQYENGTATSVDLLVALRDLNKVRTQLVSDTYDYEFSLRNLQRTTGRFETDRVKNLRFVDYGRHSRPKGPVSQKAPEVRSRKK